MVTYVVELDGKPIFFVEIKPPVNRDTISARSAADIQMRDRFRDLFDLTPFDMMYGVSAMGKHIAIYSLKKSTGTILPEVIPGSTTLIIDTAPKERWNLDITTVEGYDAFMEVVRKVKAMVQREQV